MTVHTWRKGRQSIVLTAALMLCALLLAVVMTACGMVEDSEAPIVEESTAGPALATVPTTAPATVPITEPATSLQKPTASTTPPAPVEDEPTLVVTVTPTETEEPTATPFDVPEDVTVTPVTPTPAEDASPSPEEGLVVIEDGRCCTGAIAGETIRLDVTFVAPGRFGQVADMRVSTSHARCSFDLPIEDKPWEPFAAEQEYSMRVPINFSTFAVRVQYRDAQGHLSSVLCAEIRVEGNPPRPSPTP